MTLQATDKLKFAQLNQYAKDLPECAEKHLIDLYLHFRVKRDAANVADVAGYLIKPKDLEAKLKALFAALKAENSNSVAAQLLQSYLFEAQGSDFDQIIPPLETLHTELQQKLLASTQAELTTIFKDEFDITQTPYLEKFNDTLKRFAAMKHAPELGLACLNPLIAHQKELFTKLSTGSDQKLEVMLQLRKKMRIITALGKAFSEVEGAKDLIQLVDKAAEVISATFTSLIDQAKKAIDQNNMGHHLALIKKMTVENADLAKLLQNRNDELVAVKQYLAEQVETRVSAALESIQSDDVLAANSDAVVGIMSLLNSVEVAGEAAASYISLDDVREYKIAISLACENHFLKMHQAIPALLVQNTAESFATVRQYLSIMQAMRQNTEIAQATNQLYTRAVRKVNEHFNPLVKNALETLKTDTNEAMNLLKILSDAQNSIGAVLVDQSQAFTQVSNQVSVRVNELAQSIETMDLSLEKHESLAPAYSALQELKILTKNCKAQIPALEEINNKAIAAFERKVTDALRSAESSYTADKQINPKIVQNVLIYMDACVMLDNEKVQAELKEFKEKSEIFLGFYFREMQDKVNGAFKVIFSDTNTPETLKASTEVIEDTLKTLKNFQSTYASNLVEGHLHTQYLLNKPAALAVETLKNYYTLLGGQDKFNDTEPLVEILKKLYSQVKEFLTTKNIDALIDANDFSKAHDLLTILSSIRNIIAQNPSVQNGYSETLSYFIQNYEEKIATQLSKTQDLYKRNGNWALEPMGFYPEQQAPFVFTESSKTIELVIEHLQDDEDDWEDDDDNDNIDSNSSTSSMPDLEDEDDFAQSFTVRTPTQKIMTNLTLDFFKLTKEKMTPKEILSRLESDLYNQEQSKEKAQQIKDFLLAELELFLIKIADCEPAVAQMHIDYFEKTIKDALPDVLYQELDGQLQACKAKVNAARQNDSQRLAQMLETKDITTLVNAFKNAHKDNKLVFANEIKVEIEKVILDKIKAVEGKLENSADQVFMDLKEIHKTHALYLTALKECAQSAGNKVNNYKHFNVNYNDAVLASYKKLLQDFSEQFTASLDIVKSLDVAGKIPEGFAEACNKMLVLFNIAKNHPEDYEAIFAAYPQLKEDLNAALTNMATYFTTQQARFHHLLAQKEITSELIIILDNMSKMDGMLNTVKNACQIAQTDDEHADSFELDNRNKLLALKTCDQLKQDFLDAVKGYVAKVSAQIVDNPAVMGVDPESRDSYYRDVNSSSMALRKIHELRNSNLSIEEKSNGWADLYAYVKEFATQTTGLITHFVPVLAPVFDGLASFLSGLSTHDQLSIGYRDELKKNMQAILGCIAKLSENMKREDLDKNHKEFYIWHDNARSCEAVFQQDDAELAALATTIREEAEKQVDVVLAALEKRTHIAGNGVLQIKDLQPIVDVIVQAQSMAFNMPFCRDKICDKDEGFIAKILARLEGQNKAFIPALIPALNAHKNQMAVGFLIDEQKALAGHALLLRNAKTSQIKVGDIIDKLGGTGLGAKNSTARKTLRTQYDQFEKLYYDTIRGGLQSANIVDYKAGIFANVQKIAQDQTIAHKEKITQLAAYVFAHWTLGNIKNHPEMCKKFQAEGGAIFLQLKTAHPAQVIAIFRLFRVDVEQSMTESFFKFIKGDTSAFRPIMYNHLAQVLTGEGKSVVIAASALIYSLIMACPVDAACYSADLTGRDYDEFKSLFEAFNMGRDQIDYATFGQLCEKYINKRASGDIRERVKAFMFGHRLAAIKLADDAKKPQLIFDEADQFLSEDFFSETYDPTLVLQDEEGDAQKPILALINSLWDKRNKPDQLKWKAVKESLEYKNFSAKFPANRGLILEEAVKDMLVALKASPNYQNYMVVNGYVVYKDQDGISAGTSDGYNTLWAYYKEYHKADTTVKKETFDKQVGLYLNCGSFSYSEEFKRIYQGAHISGVTGTVDTLIPAAKDSLKKDHQISEYTYVPTAYPGKDFKFDPQTDVQVVAADKHFENITREIVTKLGTGDKQRAVLAFFDTKEKLMAFFNSTEFKDLKNDTAVLCEDTPKDTRKSHINAAAIPGRVTLAVRSFGRGQDFKCFSNDLNINGGMHVISTVFPEDESEEVQIKGRTARQGGNGSYSMVLSDKDVENTYQIASNVINSNPDGKSAYTLMSEARVVACTVKFNQQLEKIETVLKPEDKAAEAFLQELGKASGQGDEARMVKFLAEQNKAPVTKDSKKTRTVICIDGTGSMSSLLDHTKKTVSAMLTAVKKTLNAKDFDPKLAEVQILIYTNYSSPSYLLQESPVVTADDPRDLQSWLNPRNVNGGEGEEAIEVAFAKINRDIAAAKVDSNLTAPTGVVLIGDAPPNNRTQTNSKRSGRYGIGDAVYFDEERQKLKEAEVPVLAIHLDRNAVWAQGAFEKIAKGIPLDVPNAPAPTSEEDSKKTGSAAYLDVAAADAAEKLTDLVAIQMLSDIGGAELVQEFMRQKKIGRTNVNSDTAVDESRNSTGYSTNTLTTYGASLNQGNNNNNNNNNKYGNGSSSSNIYVYQQ